MSDFAQVKDVLQQLLHSIEAIEQAGDADQAAAYAQSRFEKAKQQEDDLAAERANLLAHAKAEAVKLIENAHTAITQERAQFQREIKSVQDHAQAELDAIANQRARIETDIEGLRKQAGDLAALVEIKKQELGAAMDALSTAKTAQDKLKAQFGEIRQALAHAS